MIRVLIRAVLVLFLAVVGLRSPASARDEGGGWGEGGEITYSSCYEGPDWELVQETDCGTGCWDEPGENCSFVLRDYKWHYYIMDFHADNSNPPPYDLFCNISWRVQEGCCWGWEE